MQCDMITACHYSISHDVDPICLLTGVQVGTTPLISASFNGHECIVQVLVDRGADLTATTKVSNVTASCEVTHCT